MKKIFITGATGFTGMHACEYFLQKGFDVYGGVRQKNHPCNKVKSIQYDLTDAKGLERIMESILPDFILHLAAQNHAGMSSIDPAATFQVNLFGTLNLLEAVRKKAPKTITLVTGSVIDFKPCGPEIPEHPYGLSKYMQILLSSSWSSMYGLDIRIARPSNLIGPGPSNGICSLLAQKCLTSGKNEKGRFHFTNILDQRDFIDVRDVLRAYDSILTYGKQGFPYTVASGNNRTFLEAARAIRALAKSDISLTTDRFEQTKSESFDITEIKSLGWEPSIPFEQSLKDIIQYVNDETYSEEKKAE
ncbi:NAD-dependent epimerase/dehydratase family protein [Mangrovibacillus sp. Mu-81]|uniref:NAD-dependent epimerase/dehydratase family protein n=1 Tax=Mangrovibacillus sp. Mu-81 TaxID=3121478 RepID=UPI002FE47838